MNEKIYTEAFLTKSIVDDQWETDENGNPYIIIEASNDNLDFDEEKVLQEALMASRDYFLQNGIISYDHRHLPSPENLKEDPSWNEEKNILGHPVDAWLDGKTVKVKAVLYPTVERAAEIIKKLQANAKTVRASVGGRRSSRDMIYDENLGKNVKAITAVLWDECALTYKPVNQTLGPTILSPKEFVKSLSAGASTNPATMTGGNALQVQSIPGILYHANREGLSDYLNGGGREIFRSWMSGDIGKNAVIDHIKEAGFSGDQAEKIFNLVVNKMPKGGRAMKSQENQVTLDEALDDLAKSLGADEDSIRKSKKKKMSKAEDDYQEDMMGEDDDEDEDEDEDEKKVKKSQPADSVFDDLEDIEGDEEHYVEVSATKELSAMTKAMAALRKENRILHGMFKSLAEDVSGISSMQKRIAKATLATGTMLKSIGNQPAPRKTQDLQVNERFGKSVTDKIAGLTNNQIMTIINKSEAAKEDPDLSFSVQKSLRRGRALSPRAMEILASEVTKEA